MGQPELVFYIKKGNLQPLLMVSLLRSDGVTPLEIPSGSTATFSMKGRTSGTVKISAVAASITSFTLGNVEYAWAGTDTNTAGEFLGEFVLTLPGAKKQTIPAYGFVRIVISEGVI